jgi:hypothetical protein
MGGFDDDEFVTLVRVDMALAGEQPGRDYADNELRGVWPSLAFELPAVVQRIWGHNLFVHASYTLGALALCTMLVLALADRLSRRWLVAVIAAVLVVLTWTVPYNYQKLLAMTLGIVTIHRAIARPTWQAGSVAIATLVAGLFRRLRSVRRRWRRRRPRRYRLRPWACLSGVSRPMPACSRWSPPPPARLQWNSGIAQRRAGAAGIAHADLEQSAMGSRRSSTSRRPGP